MEGKNDYLTTIIIVSFNKSEYKFSTEVEKPLNLFYNEVCSYFDINPNNYNIFLKNEKLNLTEDDNRLISDLMHEKEKLHFQIFSKMSKTPRKMVLRNYRYQSSRTNADNNMLSSISTKKFTSVNFTQASQNENSISHRNFIKNFSFKKIQKFSVIINNIPTVESIQNILKNFETQQNKGNIGLLSILSDNSVRIEFSEEVDLNNFISYISYIKYQNEYFRNINIKKEKSILKKPKLKLFDEYNINVKINDVLRALKNKHLSQDNYHGLSLKKDEDNVVVRNFYKHQTYLRNASPYISTVEREILEEKENKKHFIDKNKRFVTSVGKYSMKPNFIPNYVQMTPSENPKNYEFRNVNKKKWISNKGFHV